MKTRVVKTRVVNKRNHIPTPNDIYIGRGGSWGNPFVIGKDGDRDDVIQKHRTWMEQNIQSDPALKNRIADLHGKNLVCFCAPAACHGDTLSEFANQYSQG